MNEKLIEYLVNPVKSKLIIAVMTQGTTTAKALAASNKSIPQATLYRYLKKMVDDGVLNVVEERKVRNVTEKIYALAIDFNAYTEEMLKNNSGEAYFGMFQQFTLGLLNEFNAYCAKDNIDLQNDGSGFSVIPICVTFEELKELAGKIREIIAPYAQLEATADRKAHSVALIFTPPNE